MQEKDPLVTASDPGTPPEELTKLAAHPSISVRRAVTQNPNTSKESLYTLIADFPEAFLENPALPLLLLESPGFFSQMPWQTIKHLLARANLPAQIVEAFLSYDHPSIREMTAAHPQIPVERLRLLSRSRDQSLRAGAARNRNTPPEILEALSSQGFLIREKVAQNPSAPPELLARLVQDATLRSMIAQNPSTPSTILEQLATDIEIRVRIGVAENRKTPISLLYTLAADRHHDVREAVAGNEAASTLLLKLLSQDKDSRVRQSAKEQLKIRTIPPDPR